MLRASEVIAVVVVDVILFHVQVKISYVYIEVPGASLCILSVGGQFLGDKWEEIDYCWIRNKLMLLLNLLAAERSAICERSWSNW